MTSKRRKLVTGSKSSTDPNVLLASGVKKAIEKSTAGASSSSSAAQRTSRIDETVASIAGDSGVQQSFREHLRQTIRSRTETDPDYNVERFPSCSKYLSNNEQN